MEKKNLLGLSVLVLGIISGCGSSSQSGTVQPAYPQGGAGNPNQYVARGTQVLNCQSQNEVKLQGQCMFTNSLEQACKQKGAKYIGVPGPNGQIDTTTGVCLLERDIKQIESLPDAMNFIFGQAKAGCSAGQSGISLTSGGNPFCFSAGLLPQEALYVYGRIRKNRADLAWQLELYQNGNNQMGVARGGGLEATKADGDGCYSGSRAAGNCVTSRKKGKVDEEFALQGAPNLIPGGQVVNGNPNIMNGQGGAQMVSSSYELRFITTNSFKLWYGIRAIHCEDRNGLYVACPTMGVSNTLKR